MTSPNLHAVLENELGRIAPDVELETIDRTADLREEFDIDSMDFLTLVTALAKNLNCEIPEEDYGQLGSFDQVLSYLTRKINTPMSPHP